MKTFFKIIWRLIFKRRMLGVHEINALSKHGGWGARRMDQDHIMVTIPDAERYLYLENRGSYYVVFTATIVKEFAAIDAAVMRLRFVRYVTHENYYQWLQEFKLNPYV